MNHGEMDHGSGDKMDGMNHEPKTKETMDHGKQKPAASGESSGMAGMSMDGMNMRNTALLPPDVAIGPGVDMVSMAPVDKMGDPGLGLRDVDHRVLNYRMLVARDANT